MNGKKNILNYNEIRKAGPLDRFTASAKLFFSGKKQSRFSAEEHISASYRQNSLRGSLNHEG